MLSIVTPTLNDCKGLIKTFNSIKKIDNHIFKEWIIIDSFSRDNTFKFVESLKLNLKLNICIIYENIEPKGPYDAMNYGITKSSSEYIWILNSGDNIYEFNQNNFKQLVSNKLTVVYGIVRRLSKNKVNIIGTREFANKIKFRLNEVHPSVIVPKYFYKTYGLFNTKYLLAADLDLLLRFNTNGLEFVYMKDLCVNFDYGGLSSKRSENILNFIEILFKNKIGFLQFNYLFLRYLYAFYRSFLNK